MLQPIADSPSASRESLGRCSACGGGAPAPVLALYDQERPEDGAYHLVACAECGLEWIADPPPRAGIFAHYPSDNSAYAGELGDEIPVAKRFLYWLDGRDLLAHSKPGDLVLDVGAGLGTFARYLQTHGRDVLAVDFCSPEQWPRPGVPYAQVDLNQPEAVLARIQSRLGGRRPKAIVLRHVLEHAYDPGRLIGCLARLNPDYLLVIVPNGGSLLRHVFGRHWGFFDPPRHLSNFRRKSLRALLAAAGYRDTRIRSYGMDEIISSVYRLGHAWPRGLRRLFSWNSRLFLLSSAASLLLGPSVLVAFAGRSDEGEPG